MLLNKVKDCLRENEGYSDEEIQDLIDAAKADLVLSGVLKDKVIDTDPLIKRAVILYCKANFGYDDPKQSEKFQDLYTSLKQHLTLSSEYTEVIINEGL